MHGKELLDILEKTGVFIRDSHFTLVSGYHSYSYVYIRTALEVPDSASKIGKEIAAKFKKDNIDVVVGFTRGGNILAQSIAKYLKAKVASIAIILGDLYVDPSDIMVKGDKILIVDDVLTTGNSIRRVLRVIRKKNVGKVVGIGVVVDRSVKKQDFGVKLTSQSRIKMKLWTKESCPKCKLGDKPIDLSKPIGLYFRRP